MPKPLPSSAWGTKWGLAERTLKRRFQQATRLSPNLYVQKVRVDKAKKLLLASSLPVKAIAYEVGYENVSFFVRLFKNPRRADAGKNGESASQYSRLSN
ncbi:helix-turn-helix domain-containing protein [Pseudomonas aeruginosa]